MMEYCVKFRPVKPASPHLNGKVERSQQTDLQEFYATIDLKDKDLDNKLAEWQFEYNWHRLHGALGGKTPMDKFHELIHNIPFREEIDQLYDPEKEYLQISNYQQDLQLRKCKGSL